MHTRIFLSVTIALAPFFASAHVVRENEDFFGIHGTVGVDLQQPLQPMLQESSDSDEHLSHPTKREVDGRCGPQFGSCAEGSCCSIIGKSSEHVAIEL